ncbi:MAG: LmeA family phospholipid-binding protein, partial [Xenococcaceae cyanobacterium]
MELLVSILSGLLAIGTSVNLIGDVVLKKVIRSQVEEVDTIAVRIDNAPNYQVLGGNVQRVRIATRGLKMSPEVQFKVLEFDMDRIDFDLKEFLQEDLFIDLDETPTIRLRQLFKRHLKLATRIVFTQ